MKYDIQTLIAVAGFLAGVGSTALASLQWYGNSQKKAYAAERDFQHLRRNQEQMKLAIENLASEVDDLSDSMKTMTAVFNMLIIKTGQSVSGILGCKKKEE